MGSQEVLRKIHATQSLKPFSQFGDVSSPNLRLSRHSHSPLPPFLPRLSSSSLLTSMAKKHIQLGVLPREYISRLPPFLKLLQSSIRDLRMDVSCFSILHSQPTEPHF